MNTALDDLVTKVKAIAQGPDGELFKEIVDTFFDRMEEEYFSPEDLAEIEEGFAQIRRGECLTLEEYRQGKRL
jgi:predicted transcriptional regulator